MIDFSLYNSIITGFFGNFLGRAVIAIIGLALLNSLLGCFLVWRRIAFFGDALGHAALLGVVIGIACHIHITVSVLCTCLFIAFIFSLTLRKNHLPPDVWLNIASYAALSLGLVTLSLMPWIKVDPSSILFGDILAVDFSDLWWIYGTLILVIGFLGYSWRALILLTIDTDLAQTSGIPVKILDILLMIIIALTIAVGVKAVGALLIPALLIFPAATASQWSQTPEQMVIKSLCVALIVSLCGVFISFILNTPTGPTIVLSHFCGFILSHFIYIFFSRR